MRAKMRDAGNFVVSCRSAKFFFGDLFVSDSLNDVPAR